ncbi:hypothetical protein EVA_19598, partial [gut metagenome]
TYFVRPDLLPDEYRRMIECDKLPYKMKKAQRRFYEELRTEINAAKTAGREGDEGNA